MPSRKEDDDVELGTLEAAATSTSQRGRHRHTHKKKRTVRGRKRSMSMSALRESMVLLHDHKHPHSRKRKERHHHKNGDSSRSSSDDHDHDSDTDCVGEACRTQAEAEEETNSMARKSLMLSSAAARVVKRHRHKSAHHHPVRISDVLEAALHDQGVEGAGDAVVMKGPVPEPDAPGDELDLLNYPLVFQRSRMLSSRRYVPNDPIWALVEQLFDSGVVLTGVRHVKCLPDTVDLLLSHMVAADPFDCENSCYSAKVVLQVLRTVLVGDGHDSVVAKGASVLVATHQVMKYPRLALAVLHSPLNLGNARLVRFVAIVMGPPSQRDKLADIAHNLASVTLDDEMRADLAASTHRVHVADAFARYVSRTLDLVVDERPGRWAVRMYLRKHFPDHYGTHTYDLLAEDREDEHEGIVEFSGRFLGGVVEDFRERMKWKTYVDDWTAPIGWSKFLFAVVYMYIATLVPTIAFGGLLQSITNDRIGLTETMLAQGLVGVLFALFGGNGLAILRPSGPVIAFVSVIYIQAQSLSFDFLALWSWVVLWLGFWLFVMAATDVGYLVRYVTEFTEDVFAALISVIFMYEALKQAFSYLADDEFASVAVLSLVLLILSFWVSIVGEKVRTSPFLSSAMRQIIYTLSGAIAIIVPTVIAAITKGRFWGEGSAVGVSLQLLDVPQAFFEPTAFVHEDSRSADLTDISRLFDYCEQQSSTLHDSDSKTDMVTRALEDCVPRPWAMPFWSAAELDGAIVGQAFYLGFLLALLFFVEQNITNFLMANPLNKLKKRVTIHYDMLVVSGLTFVCAFLSLPVAHACLPHSLWHLHALSDKEEDVVDGTVERHILRVHETRWTAFLVNALILLTVLLLPVLGVVPLPALYGMFLYMGWSSLSGNPWYARVKLLFTERSKYPPHHVIRRVRPWKVHLYTAIQFSWLALIFGFKLVKTIAPYFPIVILCMLPFRSYVMPFVFTPAELDLLDGCEEAHDGEAKHLKKQ